MRKKSSGIRPEGLPLILYSAFACFIFALLDFWSIALVILILVFLLLHFFRDPQRIVPNENKIAVSPADGKIVSLQEHADPLSGDSKKRISIFMNIFDVHVNRSPVKAKLISLRYFPGKFINASRDKSSEHNERNVLQLEDEQGQIWTMVQIAGLLARRIVFWPEIGDALNRGERLGMIKLGSRVDLYLPDGYAPIIEVGQKVLAGQSVLARCSEQKEEQ